MKVQKGLARKKRQALVREILRNWRKRQKKNECYIKCMLYYVCVVHYSMSLLRLLARVCIHVYLYTNNFGSKCVSCIYVKQILINILTSAQFMSMHTISVSEVKE